jgi:uncharacterized membrane protein YgaE (UPF0421/DUF939 family)
MKGFRLRPVPGESVSEAARAVAKRQAEQLTLVRRRAQPTAVYITRLTLTAVFAYLLALQLPGASSRSVLAPLTALLVVQATLFHTIRSAIQRVVGVTVGVLAAVAVAAYIPFSWWVLGLLIAGTLALGLVLRLGADTLEVPVSAMLIFAVDSHAAATSRITETLVGAAAGLAAGLIFAPLRVQPAKDAIGDVSRQMSDLLGQMADGLATDPDPRRAAEWLDRTRALRGEIERLDDALAQAEESIRLNPRRLRIGDPAAGLRDSVDTLERAATDLRVLARSIADSARLDSEDSPVKDPETRARLAAVIAELAAAVRAHGQLIETDPEPAEPADPAISGVSGASRVSGVSGASEVEPLAETLEDHLEEARRQQDRLADVLRTDPAQRPDGWPLRGEILAHVDRLRTELQPAPTAREGQVTRPLRLRRDRHRQPGAGVSRRVNRTALRVRAGRTAARVRAKRGALAAAPGGRDVQGRSLMPTPHRCHAVPRSSPGGSGTISLTTGSSSPSESCRSRSGLSRSGRHCAGRTRPGSTSVNPSKNRAMSARLRERSGVFQCRSWDMRNSPSAASGWASLVMWLRAR